MKTINVSKALSAIALAVCSLYTNAQTQTVSMQVPVPASATGIGGTTTVTVGGVTTTTATTNGVTATTISLPGTATGALTCSTGKETWTPFTDAMGNVFSPFTGCVEFRTQDSKFTNGCARWHNLIYLQRLSSRSTRYQNPQRGWAAACEPRLPRMGWFRDGCRRECSSSY